MEQSSPRDTTPPHGDPLLRQVAAQETKGYCSPQERLLIAKLEAECDRRFNAESAFLREAQAVLSEILPAPEDGYPNLEAVANALHRVAAEYAEARSERERLQARNSELTLALGLAEAGGAEALRQWEQAHGTLRALSDRLAAHGYIPVDDSGEALLVAVGSVFDCLLSQAARLREGLDRRVAAHQASRADWVAPVVRLTRAEHSQALHLAEKILDGDLPQFEGDGFSIEQLGRIATEAGSRLLDLAAREVEK